MKSIFVSSTFKDMQYERDLLNKYIVPKVRDIARKYKKDIHFTDLRWGVNTENLESDKGAKKVLEVCFDEILKCNPYMLVFIGERYGWIPNAEIIAETTKNYNLDKIDNLSVTELEIQFGALKQEDLNHCIFCFRDKLNEDSLSEEQKKIYLAESKEHEEKLELLKKKILDKNPPYVIHYSAEIKPNGEMQISEKLEKEIVEILSKKMQEEWGDIQSKNWQENEIENAKFFMNEKTANFIKREELIQYYIKKIKDKEEYFFILQGEQGSGKSSIISKMYEELIKDETLDVFPFICANSERSTTVTDIINQLNYFIATKMENVDLSSVEADTFDEARDIYINLLKQYNKKTNKTLVILVDALNELFQNEISLEYGWVMPLENQIIFATTTEEMPLPQKQQYRLEQLPLLTDTEENAVIKAICQKNHKELSETVIDEIIKLPNSNNPLYLQMVLQRLMMMDEQDFADIRTSGDNMEAINRTQINLIKNMPNDLPGICESILNSACKHIGTTVAKEALYLISLINEGLTRKEIAEILEQNNYNWNELQFATLVRYMRNCFVEKANGKIDFSHNSIRKGFLQKIEDRQKYNEMLYNYIEKIDMLESLKCNCYVKFAFLTGNIDKVIKCAYKLVKEKKILEAFIVARGLKGIMDDSSYDVHIDFIDTIIENSLETRDTNFINVFLIEILKELFCNTEDQIKLMEMILEFSLDYIEENIIFDEENENYIISKITMNLVIIEAKLCKTEEANKYLKIFTHANKKLKCDEKEKLEDKITVYKELADNLFSNQRYKEGISLFKIAIQLGEELYKIDNSKEITFSLNSLYVTLATAYQGILELEKSIDIYEKAEQKYKEMLDEYKEDLNKEEILDIDNRLIEIKMNVGDLYVSSMQYEKAEQILKETLEMNKKNVEENSTPLAELFLCNNYAKLGHLYYFTNNEELASQNDKICLKMLDLLEIKYPNYQKFCQSVREGVEKTENTKTDQKPDPQMLMVDIMKAEILVKERDEARYKEELIKKYEQSLVFFSKKEKINIYEKILMLYIQLKEQTEDKKYNIGIAEYYTKLGIVYYEKRKMKRAKEYLELGYNLLIGDNKSEEIKDLNEFKVIVINISYLAMILLRKRKYMQAFELYYEKYGYILKMLLETDLEHLTEELDECILNEMVVSLMKAKEYEEAMKFIEKFIDMKLNDYKDEDFEKIYRANTMYQKCAKKSNKREKIAEMNIKIYGEE